MNETETIRKTEANRQLAFIVLIGLNMVILIQQLIACFVIQSAIFSLAGTMLSITLAVGFGFGYHKITPEPESAKKYYFKFYIVTFWLAAYFPIRLLMNMVIRLYPRPYTDFAFEVIVVLLYLIISIFATQLLKKKAK